MVTKIIRFHFANIKYAHQVQKTYEDDGKNCKSKTDPAAFKIF